MRPLAPRTRTLVDPETGESIEATEAYEGQVPYNFRGRYTAVSDRLMVLILRKDNGLKPSDRDVLLLHIHGSDDDGVLRMVQQAIADELGIKVRTVSGSITRLRNSELLIKAEQHGRVVYYSVTPHLASRLGGKGQRAAVKDRRYPVLPGVSKDVKERKSA
jgi:DNA-binding MarR family transcriptional regulator